MDLDPRTIVFTNVIVTVMVSVSLAVFSRGHLANVRSLKTWAFATLLQSAGWTFQGFRDELPGVFPFIIGNGCLTLSIALYHRVLLKFTHQKMAVPWSLITSLFTVLALSYFYWVHDHVDARIITMSFVPGSFMVGAGWVLFKSPDRFLPSFTLTRIIFTVCGMVLIIRGCYTLGVVVHPAFAKGNVAQILQEITFLALNISSILFTYGFLLMCNDEYISRQKQSESELANIRDNLSQAQQIAKIGSWEWKLTTGKLQWSEQLYLLTHERPWTSPTTWDTFYRHLRPEDSQRFQSLLQACEREGKSFTMEHELLREGRPTLFIVTQAHAVHNINQEVVSVVGTSQDITDRKSAEAKLANERLLLRTIIDNIPVNIYVKNNRHQKILANRAEWEFVGMSSEEEVLGKDDYDLYPPEAAVMMHQTDSTVLSGTSIIGKEAMIVDKTGAQRWVLGSKLPLRDSDGQIVGIVGISVDITERKKAEEKIMELSRTKDKFFSIVAHDFRSPLTSLMTFSNLLITNIHNLSKEEIVEMSKELLITLDNTIKMADNLITWSKVQMEGATLQVQKVPLNEIIDTVAGLYRQVAADKGILLETITDDPVEVLFDRDQLTFIVRNLVNNAIKFTPRGGKVVVRSSRDGSMCHLIVSDSGIGIPPDQLEKLFVLRSGRQRKGTEGEKGTGLGLMLSQEFAQLNKGRIWAENASSGGAVFTIELPGA
jgi:PAS domain S-box-containing protein